MSLFAHSMGSQMCYMYTSLFPEKVDFTFGIDILKPFSSIPGVAIKRVMKNIDNFLVLDKLQQAGTKPPSFTFEECIKRQHLGSRESIEPQYCKYILERNTKKCPDSDKYYFSRDQRLKVGMISFMHQLDLLEYAKRITVPYTFVKTTGGPYYEGKKFFYETIDVMKENKQFELVYVEGSHHVHLNEPDKIAEVLIPFLQRYAYGDRSKGGLPDSIRLK